MLQRNSQFQVCRIQKFNMECEIERMEINYTFYFFAFLKKSDKKTIDILLLVHVLYIGIRCYVKDWLEERGYY